MSFTPREQEVLDAIRAGACSYKAIARQLGISPRTVEEHIYAMAVKIEGDRPPKLRVIMFAHDSEAA